MLIQIHIRDLVTIEELHLQFGKGCTVITGETGSGKSIFIEAIQLALGSRASASLVRPGKEKADISLSFDITKFSLVISKLKNLDLYDENNECIVRRIIMQDGRSRCYVNGIPVNTQLVKELGELLFHLHSQHEQQVLLKLDTQREILDRYGDQTQLSSLVKQKAEEWKLLQQEIEKLKNQSATHQKQIDYIQFQLDELTTLNLQDGEWEKLEIEHRKLSHSEELLRNLQQILQIFNGEEQNIFSQLASIRKIFESIHLFEPKSVSWLDASNHAMIQLNDLYAELENYLEKSELDPDRLKIVEARVSQLFNLARKHKIEPAALICFKNTLHEKLHQLQNTDDYSKNLMQKQMELEKNYHHLADTLTKNRIQAAQYLENEITHTMQSLSLPHGQFKIDIEPEMIPISLHGKDKINFLIKTNPDQTLQPLIKVISGGELSRLSLAAHLALASKTSIPTLVFDEVDTGLTGATAEKIGKLLRNLGESYQVFCITHQPQVAAHGMNHLLVEKYFVNINTHTGLRLLNAKEKIEEIARMLGGEKMTPKTVAHAEEMLRESLLNCIE